MYKKIFMGIAAVAALTLVSCSSDDLNSLSDNSSKNEAISFDGYWGRSAVSVNGSRGSVLDSKEALQGLEAGFGVFGNYSEETAPVYGENLFKNQQVTYDKTKSKWTYTPLKYWSTQGHIDFLAYAPYVKGTTLTYSKINFTVEKDAAAQKDLLWAHAEDQKKANKPVTFTFKHALAKIGYTVKKGVDDNNVTITLNSIKLAGSDDGNTNAFYTAGTIDLKANDAKDLWAPSTGDKQNFDWFSGSQEVISTSKSNTDFKTDYLFVIPQDFSQKTTGADKLYVIVDYTISYKGKDDATAEMKSTVSSPIVINFLQGKAYTINLTLGLTPIEFDVKTVEGWTDNNQVNINSWN